MPSFEKTSASSPSSTWPLITCTRGTPARQAATAWRAFEACSGGTAPRCSAASSSPTAICRAIAPSTSRPSLGRHVHELHRRERLRHLERDRVGVHAEGAALAVHPERRNDGHDAVREQRLQQLDVDALDAAGEQVVDALQDPERVRDHAVRDGGAQVGRVQALEDLVRHAVRRGEGEVERRGVGDPRALEVGRHDAALARERADLHGGAVHEHGADAQRPEHGRVHQDVAEVLVRDRRAVDGDHEGPVAELRDVLEDAPQVGRSHGPELSTASSSGPSSDDARDAPSAAERILWHAGQTIT